MATETGVSRVLDADDWLGETPTWSMGTQALWWINCEQPAEIRRWSPITGEERRWPMPKRVGGFVEKASGGLLVVLGDGVYDYDLATGALALRAASPLPDHVQLHECATDRQGRFWVGAYDHHFPADRGAQGGAWFRLDGDTLTQVIPDVSVANGLAFSADGRTMYVSNTPSRTVQAYDLDPATGALSGGRTFLTLEGPGHIDGATVDAEGGYWLAVFGAAALHRYTPDGRLDRVIDLPCSGPTKPAFGGADLATLYVTSTKLPLATDHPGFAANGGLFAVRPGVAGVPEVPFAG